MYLYSVAQDHWCLVSKLHDAASRLDTSLRMGRESQQAAEGNQISELV